MERALVRLKVERRTGRREMSCMVVAMVDIGKGVLYRQWKGVDGNIQFGMERRQRWGVI